MRQTYEERAYPTSVQAEALDAQVDGLSCAEHTWPIAASGSAEAVCLS